MKHAIFSVAAIMLAACAPSNDGAPATASGAGSDIVEPMTAPPRGVATAATKAANGAIAQHLALDIGDDLENARRGRINFIDDDAIRSEDGDIVWAINQFDFLNGPVADTVNPSLWRQSALAAYHGLFEVADGIWQVRGYDLAVMSVIAGETGWIIVDPLTAVETAAAALKLVNETLGERPVSAVIYTHSHIDHFGGVRGVLPDEEPGETPIIAPHGFADHAVAENLLAGNHMSRRAILMFGSALSRDPLGHVGSGLGPGIPAGQTSLMLPTEEIPPAGGMRMIDGVEFEFIDAGGTEAPSEFMFYLPGKKALCTAEVATATLHNLLTPRGAKVRDALSWSTVIDNVLVRYGDKSDVVFASHHWPTWGTEKVKQFLAGQRDTYRYIHDQTLRLANAGATMTEAAELVAEPTMQEADFFNRGYYGTLNHNVKAVYQFYFGWWDGVPAKYFKLPHEQTAARYVDAMGGVDKVLAIGVDAFAAGDYRWAAEVFNHAVFADPKNKKAKDWLAASYEQLGFQAESGAWRSYFLTAAQELRQGKPKLPDPTLGSAEFLRAVPSKDLFNALASRLPAGKIKRDPYTINFVFTDTGETIAVSVGPMVATPRDFAADDAVATVTTERRLFDKVLLEEVGFVAQIVKGNIKLEGDRGAVVAFLGALEKPPFWFDVVTP